MKSTDAGKTWSSWAGFGSVNAPAVSFSKNVSTSTYPPATRLKFRVRAKDAMGAYSDYSAESSAIKIHTVDAFPVVALPTSAVSVGSDAPDTLPDSVSSVTRRGCRSLCFKISFSASTDGLNRTLYFRLRKSNSAGKPGNEVDSFSLPFGKAKDSIFHRTPQLAAGLYRYDIWLDDGYEPVYIYGYEKLTD